MQKYWKLDKNNKKIGSFNTLTRLTRDQERSVEEELGCKIAAVQMPDIWVYSIIVDGFTITSFTRDCVLTEPRKEKIRTAFAKSRDISKQFVRIRLVC